MSVTSKLQNYRKKRNQEIKHIETISIHNAPQKSDARLLGCGSLPWTVIIHVSVRPDQDASHFCKARDHFLQENIEILYALNIGFLSRRMDILKRRSRNLPCRGSASSRGRVRTRDLHGEPPLLPLFENVAVAFFPPPSGLLL